GVVHGSRARRAEQAALPGPAFTSQDAEARPIPAHPARHGPVREPFPIEEAQLHAAPLTEVLVMHPPNGGRIFRRREASGFSPCATNFPFIGRLAGSHSWRDLLRCLRWQGPPAPRSASAPSR